VKKKKLEIIKERKFRKFYVNKKLEFSFFYDESEKNKDKILKDFFDSGDWKTLSSYCNWKLKDVQCSSDLTEINITVKEET